MTIEENKLLLDILQAIDGIDFHLGGKRIFQEYIKNKTQQRAVERELEIIGEAINNLLKINTSTPISYARIIVDLRNKVIHSYDSVNHTIIWKVVMKDLPVLKSEVVSLLPNA